MYVVLNAGHPLNAAPRLESTASGSVSFSRSGSVSPSKSTRPDSAGPCADGVFFFFFVCFKNGWNQARTPQPDDHATDRNDPNVFLATNS